MPDGENFSWGLPPAFSQRQFLTLTYLATETVLKLSWYLTLEIVGYKPRRLRRKSILQLRDKIFT